MEGVIHSCSVNFHAKTTHAAGTQGFRLFHESKIFEECFFDAEVSADLLVVFFSDEEILAVCENSSGFRVINFAKGEPEPHVAHGAGLDQVFPEPVSETAGK